MSNNQFITQPKNWLSQSSQSCKLLELKAVNEWNIKQSVNQNVNTTKEQIQIIIRIATSLHVFTLHILACYV